MKASRSATISSSCLVLAAVAACLNASALAQDKVKPETVVISLMNPFGVAVQPESGLVFVSTRFGIYRYDPSLAKPAEHKATVEIDGYPEPIDVYGKGPKYEIG